MPTYSYRCDACGYAFERVQRISEDAIKECPSCGKQDAKRQITQGNFILKGGGWYGDLYSGSSNKKAGAASSTTAASTATGSGAAATTTTSESSSAPASAPSAPSAPAPSSGSSGGTSGGTT